MLKKILDLIRKLEDLIESKIKSIKKLESDYDELLNLKKQLNSASEKHAQVCSRQRAALDNPVLESSRCMQMFRSGMREVLNRDRTGRLSDRLSEATGAVGRKMTGITRDIYGEESAIQQLKEELEACRTQLQGLTGGEN